MINLAISNIAWLAHEDEDVATFLASRNIHAIEVAPGRLFEDPVNATEEDVNRVKRLWIEQEIDFVAMQALLFNCPDLTVFGSSESQKNLGIYLSKIIRLAAKLGCTPLVFGSPKNRLRGNLGFDAACEIAADFFRPLAQLAYDNGCIISFEPVATDYGCDFVTTIGEAHQLASLVNHSGFRIQLDAGVFELENDNLKDLQAAMPMVTHIHASTPQLKPVTKQNNPITKLLETILANDYAGYISIEMVKQQSASNFPYIVEAIDTLITDFEKAQS